MVTQMLQLGFFCSDFGFWNATHATCSSPGPQNCSKKSKSVSVLLESAIGAEPSVAISQTFAAPEAFAQYTNRRLSADQSKSWVCEKLYGNVVKPPKVTPPGVSCLASPPVLCTSRKLLRPLSYRRKAIY